MAGELTLRVSLSHEKAGSLASLLFGPSSFNVAGRNFVRNRQNVGTAAEAILVGDVASGGYFMAINRDDENFVELRAGSDGGDLVRLEPGDVCLFRLTDDATLYAIADTDTVELEYVILDP